MFSLANEVKWLLFVHYVSQHTILLFVILPSSNEHKNLKVFLAVRNRFLFVFYLSWSQVCILPDCLKKLFVKCNSKSSKNVNEKIYFDFWRAPWFSLWTTIQNFFHICESWFGGITTAGNILYVKILFCFSLRLRKSTSTGT